MNVATVLLIYNILLDYFLNVSSINLCKNEMIVNKNYFIFTPLYQVFFIFALSHTKS